MDHTKADNLLDLKDELKVHRRRSSLLSKISLKVTPLSPLNKVRKQGFCKFFTGRLIAI
jgi:hypothetical protein